jgi:hypothetical protein
MGTWRQGKVLTWKTNLRGSIPIPSVSKIRFIKTTGTFYKQPDKSIREVGETRAGDIRRTPGSENFSRKAVVTARRE